MLNTKRERSEVHMVYVIIAISIFLLEFGIKEWVEKTGKTGEEKEILKGKLLLRKYHNKGAFLDMGAAKSGIVAIASLLLTLSMTLVLLMTFGMKGGRLMKLGLSFLLGGAYSNTYDRLHRKYVVDYLSFPVRNPTLRKFVYNLSDFCIMIGAFCIALTGLPIFDKKYRKKCHRMVKTKKKLWNKKRKKWNKQQNKWNKKLNKWSKQLKK